MTQNAQDEIEEEEIDVRVINPRNGAIVFEVNKAWPQPEPHTQCVQHVDLLDRCEDPNIDVPEEFAQRGGRSQWKRELETRVKSLRDSVGEAVKQGAPKPVWAIVHKIVDDGDRIVVVGRSVGTWKRRGEGVSANLPTAHFIVETRHYGKPTGRELSPLGLEQMSNELDEGEDDDDPEPRAREEKSEPEPDPFEPAEPASNKCLNASCGKELDSSASFCKHCGTPRGERS